ncbi:MAG: FtsK/SpoIIIE domain-containing protein, partial [Pseudonocardiales bacterium]
ERWGFDDGRASALLGMGVDGPVHIDLVADGPHALVAGTTGSGKSELLQSLVAGLAVAHPPDAISFVLIDYKGGAAFADCARLPHTVGVVTDLDAQLTGRALGSLHAELARHERLFARVGAHDLAAYRTAGPPPEALGRLVLVVDEFAALADELPDFVSGLVAIAQRGRSLGIHLVLATQRPGGVVSPEIRANTTLRVALRVADPAESTDVIGTDRAAHLGRDTPGRAVVRAGDTCTELQTARVGGPAPVGAGPEVSIAPLGCWRRPLPLASPGQTDVAAKTDLQLLVDALREAATVSGRATPRRPWLPALPGQLRLADVPRAAFATSVAFGLLDEPRQQRQPPVELDLEAGGSVLFTGGPRSGRSTALVTIAAAAAHQLAPHELAVYAIDCAGGSLRAISDLPHCGTAAARDAFDLAAALARRLEAEVIRRRAWLVAHGAGSVAEARAGGHPIPLILCLLDGWEAFTAAADEHDSGHTVDVLVRLLRTAPAAGMTVVLAGDRSTLAARLGSAVATKFVLGLSDRADYALAGIAARAVPLNMPAGRAIRAADAAEVQIAFVGTAPSPSEQAGFVRAVASQPRIDSGGGPDAGIGVIRLRSLPTRIALDALNPTPGRFTIGAGGDAAAAVSVDLFAGAGRLLIAGPARSGRSSALHTLLVQAVREGVAVVVAAPRRSPLVSAAEYHGIAVVGPDAAPQAAGLPAHPRTLLLVDDSEAFLDTLAGDALTASVRAAPAALAAVVASDSDDLALTYRGVAAEVRRSRCALVLARGPGDGDLIGRSLPRRHGQMPPGRGVLIGDPAWGAEFAEPVPIQVAVS